MVKLIRQERKITCHSPAFLRELYLFILGFLGFSILGQHILLNILHLPFSMMELYFLPLIIAKRKNVRNALRKMTRVNICSAILFLLLLGGLLLGVALTFDISILFEYRSIIYLIFVFYYVQRDRLNIDIGIIFRVSFYAMLGEIVYGMVFKTTSTVSSINCIAIAASVLSAVVMQKYVLAIVCTVLGMVFAISTGFRIGIVVVMLCTAEFLIYLITANRSKKKVSSFVWRLLIIMMAVILIFQFITNYDPIVKFVADAFGMDYFAVFRVTERIRGLVLRDSAISQDTQRIEIMAYPLQRLWQIIPRGLIGESIGEYWLYIDVPILYLFDIFGSIAAIGICFWIVKLFISNIKKYRLFVNNNIKLLSIWMFPVFVLVFIINGTFMVAVYQAIETGLFLGILANKKLQV